MLVVSRVAFLRLAPELRSIGENLQGRIFKVFTLSPSYVARGGEGGGDSYGNIAS